MQAEVAKVIEVIRPAIQADDGDITLHSVDEETGVVTVALRGACEGCSASTEPLKAGVQRILMDRVEGVTAVVQYIVEPATGPTAEQQAACPRHATTDDGTAVTL